MSIVVTFLCGGFIMLMLYWWYEKRRQSEKLRWIPSAPGMPILGNVLEFKNSTVYIPALCKHAANHNGLCSIDLMNRKVIITTDYDFVQFVLTSMQILDKSTEYKFLHKWLGMGLLTAPKSAMRVSIGAQKNSQSDYVLAVKDMCRIVVERVFSPIQNSDILFPLTKNYYKEQKNVKVLHSHTLSVIREREKELSNRTLEKETNHAEKQKKMAFLDLLLQSTVDGRPLTMEEIREEVDTFMFERKVIEEQHQIFGSDRDRNITYTDLQEMKYLDLVIKETLRLYPSVPFVARVSNRNVKYKDGKIIPAGIAVVILIIGVNRDPITFPEPDKFDPSRFERSDKIRPYSYIPFSAGSRNCIGQKFAILEMKAVVSKLLRNFVLLPSGEEPILCTETILKSKNGVKIKLRKRKWM